MQVRLQKVIAASGLASRRRAEDLILQGSVTVNGTVVRKLGTCVDPANDHIKVNGEHLGVAEPEVFILLHKPAGYLTTLKDPQGRPTVADLLDRVRLRVVPVGRLDYDAEGLLLLTNNGRIAQACLHPKFHVPKTYLVKVSKVLTDEELGILREGIELEDGMTSPAIVKKSGKAKVNSWIEMTIFEGRSHQVKRMLEAVGHRVKRLKRVRFGPLALGDLLPGSFRFATDAEANALRNILKRTPRKKALASRNNRTFKSSSRPVSFKRGMSPEGRERSEGKKFRTPKSVKLSISRGTSNTPWKKSAFSKSPGEKPSPQMESSSRIESRQGQSKKRVGKRPAFPKGVNPQVVLQAFFNHEKQARNERMAGMTRQGLNTKSGNARGSGVKFRSPSPLEPSKGQNSRSDTNLRTFRATASARSTRPQPQNISPQKRKRA